MGRSARFVATLLAFQPLVMSLLPAMSVPSLSAALAMSTSARKGTNAALSARLDTRDRKVALEFMVMMRRKMLMTWTMNSTISKAMGRAQSGSFKEMTLICLHLLAMTHTIGFHALQVDNRYLERSLMHPLTVILSAVQHRAMLIQAFQFL